jgi:uncharacterized repeat protein (TIGR01451 family)
MPKLRFLNLLIILALAISLASPALAAPEADQAAAPASQDGQPPEGEKPPEDEKPPEEQGVTPENDSGDSSQPALLTELPEGVSPEAWAMSKIDPLLHDEIEASQSSEAVGGGEILVQILASPEIDLSRYGQVVAQTNPDPLGLVYFLVRVSPRLLVKIAGRTDVAAIASLGPKPAPEPPDPEAPGVTASPVEGIDAQRAAEAVTAHASAQAVSAPEKPQPAQPDSFFENDTQGVRQTWLAGITGNGDVSNPLKYAVIDTGVDFCNPALLGRWAVQPATGNPAYVGWPIAYDDTSATNFVTTYPAPGSGYNGNWGWYVRTIPAPGPVFTDTLYSKTYTITVPSASGLYRYGYHPDSTWHALAGASPVILAVDSTTPLVYDQVWIDGNWDGIFDTPINQSSPAGCIDWTSPGGPPDGVADDSYGLLYWISDGINPPPGVSTIFAGAPAPMPGEMLMFMINDVAGSGGNHGTMCASSAAGFDNGQLYSDPTGILPAWFAPGTPLVQGPGSGGSFGPGVDVIAMGNFYAGGSNYNNYYFTVFGYDAIPASGDDAQIVSLSFGSGVEDADAWDFQSEYLASVNLHLENGGIRSPMFVKSSGNGGNGYGTVNTPGSTTGIAVGASTQYGNLNTWGANENVSGPAQVVYQDVQPWSDRGPSAMGTLAPHVVANGAWGTGAIPANQSTYYNGYDGAAAWTQWGGTSRSAPVAAGIMALIYDAYQQGHGGVYPDWRMGRELIMNGAIDLTYDEFVAGAGQAYALRSALLARGDYGVEIAPSFYHAGAYPPGAGANYESFASGLLPGQSDTQVFTVNNVYTAPITVNLRDEQLQQIAVYTASITTLSPDLPTNYAVGLPDYVYNLTPWVTANPTADLMIVRVTYPFEYFDTATMPPTPATFTDRWIGLVYNVYDDGDGIWWTDTNGDGRVTVGETDAGDDHIRFAYSYLRNTQQEVRVHNPLGRMGSGGIWFGATHNTGAEGLTLQVEVIFYEEQDWDQVTLSTNSLVVPPGGTATFQATINSFVGTSFLSENFDGVTAPALPTNWATAVITGTDPDLPWVTSAGRVYPSGAAHSSPNVARFRSYNIPGTTDSSRLYRTVGVDLSGTPSAEIAFWMYHDTGYTTAPDRVQVQISTDGGTTWINVGSPFYRYLGSGINEWRQHIVDLSAYTGPGMTDVRIGFLGTSAYGNDCYLDDIEVRYQVNDAPGLYTGRIVVSDPGVGMYAAHETVIPVVKNVFFEIDPTTAATVGGAPRANTPYDNGYVYGSFSWGSGQRAETGDWRMFPYLVSNPPAGAVTLVDNQWEDYPTDIDTLLLDQAPLWNLASAGGPPPNPAWFGPHTMDDLGHGSARMFTGSRWNWYYYTNIDGFTGASAHEFVSAPASAGLGMMLQHAVLFGGQQPAVPFTATVALASVTPNPVNIGPGLIQLPYTVNMSFQSGMDLDGLVLGNSFGWYQPLNLTGQPIYQDNPGDPMTSSWVYPLNLAANFYLDVTTSNGVAAEDLDLNVVRDNDSSGTWTAGDTVVGSSGGPDFNEHVRLNALPDGDYLIAVHGFSVSGAPGYFDIAIKDVRGSGALSASGLPSPVVANTLYNFTVDLNTLPPGAGAWEGLLLFGPPQAPSAIEVPVYFYQGGAEKTAWQDSVLPGDLVTYTIALTEAPGDPVLWSLTDPIPAGMNFVSVQGATYAANQIQWSGLLGSSAIPNPEQFEGSFVPAGWRVIDNAGNGRDWKRNDSYSVVNRTTGVGGTGYSAAVEAPTGPANTELWSPLYQLNTGTIALTYLSNFQDFVGNGDAYVDISTDNGNTWTNVFAVTVDEPSAGIARSVDLSAYAGQIAILRWRYVAASGSAWYWHIDNVNIPGTPLPLPSSHTITLTLEAVNTGLITNTATIVTPPDTAQVSDSVFVIGAIPTWDKDVWINGTPYNWDQGPFTVEAGDTVEVVDQVSVITTDPVTYTLDEAWTDSLDFITYTVDFGSVTMGANSLIWDVTGGVSNTLYTLTKTFTVNDYNGFTDFITETLAVEGGSLPETRTIEFNIPSAAIIDVTPDLLTSIQYPDIQTTQVITISNLGNIDLDWLIQEEPEGSVSTGKAPVYGQRDKGLAESANGYTAPTLPAPEGNGPTLTAPSTTLIPSLDGSIAPGEWDDAFSIDITLGGNPVIMYIKYTANFLYMAFDDQNDTTLDGFDQVGVYFDDEGGTPPILYDNVWTNSTCGAPNTGEGNYWLGNFTPDPDDQWREWIVGPTACAVQYGSTNTVVEYSVGSGHMQYELAIPLGGTTALVANPEETFGLRVYTAHTGSTFTGRWPNPSTFNDPATYGNLYLGQAVPCSNPSDIPWVDVSPTSGTLPRQTSQSMNVTFDSTGLAAGTYAGNLCVASNDLVNPLVVVPVTLTVESQPVPTYTLDVNIVGSGTVDLDPPGGVYVEGTVVTLTATPDPGWFFAGWSGDLGGLTNPQALTMDSNKVVTATFSSEPPVTYTLDVNIVGDGTVDLAPPGGVYDEGTVVTLTATPDAGWYFAGWSGDLGGLTNPQALTMDSNKVVTATFSSEPPVTYTLDVNIVGSGSVTLDPVGGVYLDGTVVTLTAAADAGWEFSAWSGDLSGNTNPITITMDADKVVTATFTALGADLQVVKLAPESVIVSGAVTYTIIVTNLGSLDASNVLLTDTLPVSATFVSATAGCTHTDGVVTCDLGDLADGESATVVIVATAPGVKTTLTNTVDVMADELDPDLDNNTATVETMVVMYDIYLPVITKGLTH